MPLSPNGSVLVHPSPTHAAHSTQSHLVHVANKILTHLRAARCSENQHPLPVSQPPRSPPRDPHPRLQSHLLALRTQGPPCPLSLAPRAFLLSLGHAPPWPLWSSLLPITSPPPRAQKAGSRVTSCTETSWSTFSKETLRTSLYHQVYPLHGTCQCLK